VRLNQVTVSVHNTGEGVAFYRQLGLEQFVLSPHYARLVCPDDESTFSIHLGEPGGTTVVYFEDDQLEATVAQRVAGELKFGSLPADQAWLWREARLRDPSGNEICLYHAGENRLNPPWRLPETIAESTT
jgi:catechol 2,3-dioxygenase-like lactoylglutathione lyase family enzyme